MRTSRSITALAFSTCTVLTLAGCSDGSVPTAEGAEMAGHDHGVTTLYGPENELGEGISRAYIVVDHGGRPREVGIRMSESVLTGLPEGPGAGTTMLMPALPAGAPDTGSDHVMLGWNPNGHDPEILYGAPHFDMHFYTTDADHEVDPAAPDFAARAARLPEPEYVPEGYIPPPGPPVENTVPFMGMHWTGTADDVIPGSFEFTEVLLNGSWDGEFIFIEPMMTREWLATKPSLREIVKQPSSYRRTGYYPTVYTVDFDEQAGEYVVALSGLTMREAS
ncbi:hypothetical protein Y013_05010 [Rhodococcus pyridinivorans SB3094]|uniref:TTHB210-like domain-containing protein n=1 Tax=Rhodococcus pyridinivorans SB3094 TaxID=1435356 RepID=V9XFH4_9NOCA|nr:MULTISPECIES: DUF5602 domain-containing protein [Rhodococcus]AHD20067.1 hypothetical protein Y013_05010 [Rhodococcus pyridinivorans SB3094]MCT7292210.1 DUF5602 domain-containing protein [Rhodococcus sp. PAE-6]